MSNIQANITLEDMNHGVNAINSFVNIDQYIKQLRHI